VTTYSFDRLVGAVAYIAGHSDTPEKPLAVYKCLDDIETRYAEGLLRPDQRKMLVAILFGQDTCPSLSLGLER
jgi:hypothetical protein